jgi:hypothetical protein
VELCLLLPAQLRVLVELVLLPRLVVPLAYALSGPDELVAQGLRTAEYWVSGLAVPKGAKMQGAVGGGYE